MNRVTGKELSRRELIRISAWGAGAMALAGSKLAATAAASPPARPNILLVLSDQQHWQALGCQDPFFQTPNLDRLAKQSVLFERAFCSTPQCSPSRSSLLTGLYPSKTGVWGNVGAAGGRKLKMPTVGKHLQKAGYYTAYFGKWHLGDDPAANAGWNEADKRTNDALATRNAVAFLDKQAGAKRPFALFVSYLNPHDIYHFRRSPEDVPGLNIPLADSWAKETFANKPAPQKQFMTHDQGRIIWGSGPQAWRSYRDLYRQKVGLYDAEVGKVLAALKAAGQWDNTLIVATSDHGDMDTAHKLIFKGPFLYEHMVRVPLIIRVPAALGGPKARRIRQDTVNVDLVPTLLDFAGAPPVTCQGSSLKPALTASGPMPRRDFVVSEYYSKQRWVNPIRMLRTDQYKYNRYILHGEELYDLKNDPHELVNLAGSPKYAKVQKELSAALDKWIRDNNDPFAAEWPTDRQGRRLPGV